MMWRTRIVFSGIGAQMHQETDSLLVTHYVPHDVLDHIRPWVLRWGWHYRGKGMCRGITAFLGSITTEVISDEPTHFEFSDNAIDASFDQL